MSNAQQNKTEREVAHQQQQKFLSALLQPSQAAPANLRHPKADQPVASRFNIYRNNVVYSLRTALADKFPKLQKLVGDAAFDALADGYVRDNLPRIPPLFIYGDDLPDYLSGFVPLADVPYAGDVARLEILWLASYHAADHTPLMRENLLAHNIENAVVRLAPALQLLASAWPIYDIWQFLCDAGNAPDASKSEAPQSEGWQVGQSVLIFRDAQLMPQVALLPTGGAQFIAALQAGAILAEAAEHASNAALSQTGLQEVMNLLVHKQQICDLFEKGKDYDKTN